jgi:hypothetical protein
MVWRLSQERLMKWTLAITIRRERIPTTPHLLQTQSPSEEDDDDDDGDQCPLGSDCVSQTFTTFVKSSVVMN